MRSLQTGMILARSPGGATLAGALAALVLGWLGPLAFPFRLLTTIIHELSHGLVALVTGGQFVRFVAFADGSGVAYTAGGIRWLIIPAGYVGTALFGAGLIRLGRSPQRSRVALGVLGAALVILSLRYGLPSVFSPQILSGLLTVVIGAGLGALFILVARRAWEGVPLFLLNLVAFWVGLSALGDLGTLFTVATVGGSGTMSDAHAMAQITLLPPAFWAVAWVALAAVELGSALWRTWFSPRRAA
jgi:hypothetical protein